MLKKLGARSGSTAPGAQVPIGEASYPAPFESTLEFNAPAHGVWNIVHTGMLIPESHQIYVCSPNCMRGVVLTAAEMGAADRFSQVLIEEKDVLAGSIERLTVEGVSDCLHKLPQLPKAVLVFTVCVHHFMGSDLNWIYRELERRFPEVTFIRCFMDPIMKKSGLTPDQKMRKSLYEPIRALPIKEKTAALLGSDFALEETADLRVFLEEQGYELKELPRCTTYEEYLSIGESEFFLACYPAADAGARALAGRLGRPYRYLPLSFDPDEMDKNQEMLDGLLLELEAERSGKPVSGQLSKEAVSGDSRRPGRREAETALLEVKELAGDTEIAIDYTFHPRPLGLARLLLDYGFRVTRVYLDVVSGEEEAAFYELQRSCPDLLLCATVRPECRILHETKDTGVLALGQKAAWFTASRHFVNIVEGAGWYGYDGMVKLAGAMRHALLTEQDPETVIPRKGLGCTSCVLL